MDKKLRTEGKIKAHYGMSDYYTYFKKIHPELKITKTIYSKVIDDYNKEIVNLIINDNIDYQLPNMGSSISIKKMKHSSKIVNGKLLNTAPVDWVTTNKLWFEDEEAREKKLLVRFLNPHTSKHVFRIKLKKYIYPFKNKKYYKFKAVRSFSRLLAKRIKDEEQEKYNAYNLY